MTTNALTVKSVAELRQLATATGISRANELKKSQLIRALADQKDWPAPPVFRKERPFGPSSSTMTVKVSPNAPSTYPEPGLPPVGLPIPNHYGTNRVVLMVQSPHRLFAYWMVDAAQLADALNSHQLEGHPVLLLMSNGGIEQREIELHSGNAYLSAVPKCSYRAALAIRDINGAIHHLVTSNHVTMPSDSYSPEEETAEENYQNPFHELFELAAMRVRAQSNSSSGRLDDQDSERMRLVKNLPSGVSSSSRIHR
jgi:hypothetical protein